MVETIHFCYGNKPKLKAQNMKDQTLPPGQRETKTTPLRHIGPIPKINPNTWRLEVTGEIEKPTTYTLEELKAKPSIISIADFHCVEGWTISNNKWEGIPFETIAKTVKPKENAKYVTFECEDGYTTSLPLSDLLQDKALLAYKLNDKPLPPERGAPLRLIVSQKYAYKNPMWLKKIKFTTTQETGYWETRGYSNTANPWKNQRYQQ
jgi:DMSO/TMAO reductase YedYZ molybdopterin-dependent catalytic subunit